MGRAPCCEKVGLKKGRWTAEEDQLLVNYIKANGEGSWRSLPKNAGLLRCGKSCRLRWINYLREDLKRGNITLEEEDTIIKLQATLGNRWSLIAGHLPGRTDNEIKNYWNSHLSKKAQGLADDDEGDQSAGPEKASSSSGKRKRGAAGCKESTATKKKKKRSSSSTNNNNNNLYGKTKDTATKKQQKKSMSSLGATTGANKDSDSTLTSTDPTADDGMLQTSGDGSPGVDGPDLLHELEKEEEEEEKEEEGVAQDSVGLLGAVTAPSKEVAVGGSHGEGEGRAMSSLTEEKDVGRATTSITMSSSSEETSSTNRANLGLDGINGRAMKAGGGQEEESFNFEGFENLPWEEAGDMWKWNWLWDGQELDIQQPNLGFDLSEDNLESWLFSDIL